MQHSVPAGLPDSATLPDSASLSDSTTLPDSASLPDLLTLPNYLPRSRPNLISLPTELLLEITDHLFTQGAYIPTHNPTNRKKTNFHHASALLRVSRHLNEVLTPYFYGRAISDYRWPPPPNWGRSLMHWAVAHNGSRGLIQKLILYGGSKLVNDVDFEGLSPIFVAAMHNNFEAAELLLNAGANPNSTALGLTPVLCTVVLKHHDTLRVLLNAGGDPEADGFSGSTALHLASMIGVSRDANLLKAALIEAGGDWDTRKSSAGYTAVQIENIMKNEIFIGNYQESLENKPIFGFYDDLPMCAYPLFHHRNNTALSKADMHMYCRPGCELRSDSAYLRAIRG